jgi:hypothetical protein
MPLSLETNTAARAAGHVAKSWFPINRNNLEQIRSGLSTGRYNKSAIIADIKSDASLYLLCVRKLAQMAKDGGFGGLTPSELIENAEFETISTIISSPIESDINHKFSTMSDVQAARLMESVLSASTVEALSNTKNLDGELGYSCALLRQLGLTLIAWNYPHVYRRALENSGITNTNLESEIQKVLGFTPSSLAVLVTQEWNLSPLVSEVIGNSENNQISTKAADILELCRIGEALARANDPENYPSALQDWNTAEEEIEKLLGRNQMDSIRELIARNLRAYSDAAPKLFRIPTTENIPSKICSLEYSKKLLTKNDYIEKCSPLLKMQLKELYASFAANEISRDSVHKLVKEIIPSAGFERGCIFMFEPSSNSLVPVLKIGAMPEHLCGVVTLDQTVSRENTIAVGFYSQNIVKQTKLTKDGVVEATWFCGALGETNRTGVLYLEANSSLMTKADTAPQSYFMAIKKCLADCLGLR